MSYDEVNPWPWELDLSLVVRLSLTWQLYFAKPPSLAWNDYHVIYKKKYILPTTLDEDNFYTILALNEIYSNYSGTNFQQHIIHIMAGLTTLEKSHLLY